MIDIERLIKQIDIHDYISRFVELEKIGEEYFGLCPLHNENTASFSVDTTKKVFYCFGCGAGGTVLDFIMAYNHAGFKKALEILCEDVGGDVEQLSNISELTKIFKKFTPTENKDLFIPPIKMRENVMNKYSNIPIKEWLDEGISNSSLKKYQVRYDLQNNRIVFPIWDNDGNIISICGRTLDPNYKEKRIRKYTYYSKINSTYFFYGYWQNKDKIIEMNEILIFEGAKSVMKSEEYGYENAVASMTDKLSPMQIEELIKIPVRDVVICWDKGVLLNQIKEKLGLLLRFKNCYCVIDNQNLLNDKDSPVDQGKDVWINLYKNKRRVMF